MKKFIRIIALILSTISVFLFVSCDKNNNSASPVVPDVDIVGSKKNAMIASTGNYILKDGVTEYAVVIPEGAGANVSIGAEELNLFFGEATGKTFSVVKDSTVTYSEEAKYISIGNTTLLNEAGVSIQKSTDKSECRMVTKGKSVFLFGTSDLYSLYAVYDFLEYILDFDYIYEDCYNLDKNVTEIELKAYDVVNVPDVEYRSVGYGWIMDDTLMKNRMRVQYWYSNMVAVNGLQVHNAVNYAKYNNQHIGHEGYWFTDSGAQVCLTAHGNEEEYEALQNACLTALKAALKSDKDSTIVTFTQMDLEPQCNCDEGCKKVIEKYGELSAVQLLFVNDLKGRVDEWFESEDGKPYARDLEMIFFSYHDTCTAPGSYNEQTGEYTANNGIQCADGVSVWYAPIHGDFNVSLYNDKNAEVLSTIKKWQAVDDENMFLYFYSAPYNDYLVWYNDFDSMVDIYKIAKEINAKYVFSLAQFNTSDCYAWGVLKSYLSCKLAWDSSADIQTLTDKFFENYFGPVSKEMKEYYLMQRAYLRYLSENTNYSCSRSASNPEIGKAEYWTKPVLSKWLSDINKVIDGLVELKRENFELYNKYYLRIANERVSVLYLLVDLYSDSISADKLMDYKMQFKADTEALGMDVTGEAGGCKISTILSEWGM